MSGSWNVLLADWQDTLMTLAAPGSRRAVIGRLGLVLGGVIGLGVNAPDLQARRKKKRKQTEAKPAKPSDWTGRWSTKLSNGVSGSANFTYDSALRLVRGTYSNSVGSGTLNCEVSESIFDAGEYVCSGDYQQEGGETGAFIITLSDSNHWSGTYYIDGSGYTGSWRGVRN